MIQGEADLSLFRRPSRTAVFVIRFKYMHRA